MKSTTIDTKWGLIKFLVLQSHYLMKQGKRNDFVFFQSGKCLEFNHLQDSNFFCGWKYKIFLTVLSIWHMQICFFLPWNLESENVYTNCKSQNSTSRWQLKQYLTRSVSSKILPLDRSKACIEFVGKWRDVTCLSVTSISFHSFKARGLIFGMCNPHINGSKSAEQNFDILYKSWDIYVQSYVVN